MVASRALRTWQNYVAIAVFVSACTLPKDVPNTNTAILTPSSAYADTALGVNLTSENQNFSSCSSLSQWSTASASNLARFFMFYDQDGIPVPEVSFVSMESVRKNQLSMVVSVSKGVAPGQYELRFQCSSKKTIAAKLIIKKKTSQRTLRFEPDVVVTGGKFQKVLATIESEDGKTSETPATVPTSIIFEDGANMSVASIQRTIDPPELDVRIQVSDLALGVGVASKTVNVSFVYFPEVFTGQLTILPDKRASVAVTPSTLEKPAANQAPVSQGVMLTGENITFDPADGESTEANISVSAPENPGMHVQDCVALTGEKLSCTVVLENSAYLGPTALAVQSGESKTYTTVNIIPSDFEDKIVRFWPPIMDGCALSKCLSDASSDSGANQGESDECDYRCPQKLVIAELVGATIDDSWTASIATPGVKLERITFSGDNYVGLWLEETGKNDSLSNVEILFSNGITDVRGQLPVRDIAGKSMRRFPDVQQGAMGIQATYLQQGELATTASIKTLPRSGIRVGWQDTLGTPQKGLLLNEFQVAPDAPTGPSFLTISGDATLRDNSIPFAVLPSSADYISASPDFLWLEKPSVVVTFAGHGDVQFSQATRVRISDSALQLTRLAVDEATNRIEAEIVMAVSAQGGIKTVYFEDGPMRAAVNLLAVKNEKLVLNGVEPQQIERTKGQAIVRTRVPDDFLDNPVAVSVFGNIGISIQKYYTYIENSATNLALVFSLENDGPGGWIGVQVVSGPHRLVVPVEVVAANKDGDMDDSLNAVVEPVSMVPGAENVKNIDVSIPDTVGNVPGGAVMGRLVSDVYAIDRNVLARLDSFPVQGGATASLQSNFAYSLNLSGSGQLYPGVPVCITASEGALVGFWDILPEDIPAEWRPVLTGTEWTGIASQGGSVRMAVSFTDIPSAELPSPYLIQIRGQHTDAHIDTPIDLALLSSDESIPIVTAGENVAFGTFNSLFRAWAKSIDPFSVTVVNFVQKGEPYFHYAADSLCEAPWLALETIAGAFETDAFSLPDTGGECRLAVAVSAYSLDDSAAYTADVAIDVCDGEGGCILAQSNHLPKHKDVTVFANSSEVRELVAYANMGSTGYYVVNVRSASIIQRVNRATDNPYVELEMEPGVSMDGCRLRRLDTGQIDEAVIAEQPLSGEVPEDGRVIVSELSAIATVLDTTGTTRFEPATEVDSDSAMGEYQPENFKFSLVCQDVELDVFQVGGVYLGQGSPEGPPLANRGESCYSRVGNGIDTNRNAYDFAPSYQCTIP